MRFGLLWSCRATWRIDFTTEDTEGSERKLGVLLMRFAGLELVVEGRIASGMNRFQTVRTVLLLLVCVSVLAGCRTARKYKPHFEYKGEQTEQPVPR